MPARNEPESPLPALVLTAGLATRLRPLSSVRAKAALPVNGEPLACRVLRQLAAAGVRDAVLNLHHLPHTLTALVGDGSDLGLRVRYSWEGAQPLGRAGGPRHALGLLGASRFVIVNGDTLSTVDLGAVVAEHRSSGALVTLAVVPNQEPDKYSGIDVTADGAVTGFVPRAAGRPSFHYYGVQVVEASVFAALPDNTPAETIPDLYSALFTTQPGSVRALVTDAEYFDIGTPADYLATSLAFAEREGANLIGRRAHLAATARVERSILWDDVEVGEGVLLRECVIADGARVPADTSWIGVTIRSFSGDLAAGEKRVGNLAVAGL